MKPFSLFVSFWLAGALPCLAIQDEEGWSEPVDGVRGRLVTKADPDFHGTAMIAVFLELQNVSDVGNPKYLWFGGRFEWQLVDSTGAAVEEARAIVASITSPGPYWITLPYDSTVRFRVSVSGYGIRADGGVAIQLPEAFWQVPRTTESEYYLSATFRSAPPEGDHRRAWSGSLVLPRVIVPQQKRVIGAEQGGRPNAAEPPRESGRQ